MLRALLDKIPLTTLVIIALTLGLAPFAPEPHVWEKLKMLAAGTLALARRGFWRPRSYWGGVAVWHVQESGPKVVRGKW